MSYAIHLVFACAVALTGLSKPVPAAPPASCVNKFVGVWSYAGGTTRVNADGTANPTCVMCVAVQTWTCSGNTYTITGPTSYTATLTPDGRQMVGSAGIAVRSGGAASAAQQNADPAKPAQEKQAKRLPPATGSKSGSCSDITGLSGAGGSAIKCPPQLKRPVASAQPAATSQTKSSNQDPEPQPGTSPVDQKAALAGKVIDELGRVRAGQITAPSLPGTAASTPITSLDPRDADTHRFDRPSSAPEMANSCVPYFQSMMKNFERSAALCLKDSRLMRSLTEAVETNKSTADDRYITRNSAPELFAYFDPMDPRWNVSGDKAYPNCELPLTIASQSESFMECARVYWCGAAAARCGLNRAEQTKTNQCLPISRACLAENPVPQRLAADPTPPKYEPPVQPAPLPAPPKARSTITGPSGPGGGSHSGGVTTAR
jgi:hypothetical protein